MSTPTQIEMANAIRALAMDAVEKANSGHPGMPMGMADVSTVLFTQHLKFYSNEPNWPDRDRFILSAGHGSMLIYALAYLLGYDGIDIEDLKNFRQLNSKTAGHPEFGHAPAVETTTGPLGQGISNAVGFAIAEAHMNALYGDSLVDHHTYVIAGDGCLMEGVSQEAISLAGHLKLRKLIVLWDDNDITIDGALSLADSTNQIGRFESCGWDAVRIDGHDPDAINAALTAARESGRPSLIACKTIIGKGSPSKAGTAKAHGAPLGEDEITGAREALDWPHASFEIPQPVLSSWRQAGIRGAETYDAWRKRSVSARNLSEFEKYLDGVDKVILQSTIQEFKRELIKTPLNVASRVASQKVLEQINPVLPNLIGGSADLTGSNNTRTSDHLTFEYSNYAGRYIHYGVREHAMAAAMNGIALHGGVVPYGGAFLVFSDYCRASIRLAALMGVQSIFVFTHDSIGLGEDGPTHQPVEHLAALRAIPNLNVFRPADIVETAECWEAALLDNYRPSILALSRQTLPQLRVDVNNENLSARGAYVIRDAENHDVTILATGSEVAIAAEAADRLSEQGIGARIVSMPNWRAFEEQDASYKNRVLGDRLRIAIEAASSFGWERWIDGKEAFIGIDSFGASGPKDDLYQHYGLTSAAVTKRVMQLLDCE